MPELLIFINKDRRHKKPSYVKNVFSIKVGISPSIGFSQLYKDFVQLEKELSAVLGERLGELARIVEAELVVQQNISWKDVFMVESIPLDDSQSHLLEFLGTFGVLLHQEAGEVVVSQVRAGDEGFG